jgi:hypothetical protein
MNRLLDVLLLAAAVLLVAAVLSATAVYAGDAIPVSWNNGNQNADSERIAHVLEVMSDSEIHDS